MNGFSAKRGQFSAGNPIANLFVVIVGTLVIAASIVLGFLAFMVLAAIVMVLAAVIGIRLWWFKRKLQKANPPGQSADPAIEGEFIVVERQERDGDS